MNRIRRSSPLLLAAFLATTNNVAQAQAGASNEDSLDEIIVTAEKLGRTVQETTTSAVVLTGAEIESRSFEDLYDIVLRTPNVAQSFGEKGFSIRGIDQRSGAGAGLLVTTLVDGASLPNNQSTFFGPYSAWDLGQVEILRGPQGTTQGRNAIGGAIIVNTADPVLDELSGKTRLMVGQRGTYQVAGALNVPIAETVAARLAVEQRETDGWVDNPTLGSNYDAREFTNARLKLRWAPSNVVDAVWTINFTDSFGGEDAVEASLFPDERANFSGEAAEEGSEHLINTIRFTVDLNDAWSATSITSAYQHDYTRIEDIDQSPAPLGLLDLVQDDNAFTQEIRFNFDNGGAFRGVFGGYYGRFDNESTSVLRVPLLILGIDPAVLVQLGIDPLEPIDRSTSTGIIEENVALFGEVEYDFADRWTLIAGARLDSERRSFDSLSATSIGIPVPFPLPPDELIAADNDYDAFLPKAGVRFAVNDEVTLGLTAQRAYRAGGVGFGVVSGEPNEYDPEFAWSYEFSVRALMADRKHRINANVFYTDWTDQVVSRISDFGNANGIPLDTVPDNAGESQLTGLEIQWDAFWTDELDTFVSIGLLDAGYDVFDTELAEFSDNDFPYAPDMTISAGVNYRHPSGFTVIADVAWSDQYFSVSENDPARAEFVPLLDSQGTVVGQREICTASPCNDPATITSSYTVANAKVGWQASSWSVFVFARNLFDEEYDTQRFAFATDFATGQPVQRLRSGEPRMAGIEFNYVF